MIPKGPFKDTMGKFRTLSLFWENKHANYDPVFTLKEHNHEVDGVTYYSLRQIYLSFNDPTEYRFAIEIFGSWDQWQRLVNNAILFKEIRQWREELEVKMRAMGIDSMAQIALNDGSRGMAAAKWLAEGNWKQTRGRPSKEEKEHHLAIEARLDEDVKEILKGIDLH